MATESGADIHHGAPRCLLGLFDAAAAGLADCSEFIAEAERLSIEVRGLSGIHDRGRRRVVEEIIGRLPELTESQLGRLEDEIRRERQRRASSVGVEQDVPRLHEDAAPLLTEVSEYRPHEDGYLQLELRRYIRRDGSVRERRPYWYFHFHEGGKRRKLCLGKTSDPESTLAAKRSKPLEE